MKKIDWYILKRYLVTFVFTLLILIPIAVAIDVSEKIDKFLYHDNLGLSQILEEYYKNFVIYYANTFMPLAVFIAVILFTSKLANNSEIIAITNAKISFTRFLLPYFIGATILTILALSMNHFVVPKSNKVRKKFEKEFIDRKRISDKYIKDFSLQLSDSTYIYIRSFNIISNSGYYFTKEIYNGLELTYKLTADNIQWNEKDSTYKLTRYKIRKIYKDRDSIFSGNSMVSKFKFLPKDLIYKSSLSQEMPSDELMRFITISKKRGVKNLNTYLVEYHKRTSLPFATYILTLIAVTLAYRKRRGGTGVNLAIGVGIMFLYIFFLKISEVLGSVAGVNSLVYVWFPNLIFGILALYLYSNARK